MGDVMKYFKLLFSLMLVIILSACSSGEFMDLSGFIYQYNKVSSDKIDFCDFSFEKDENRDFKLIHNNLLLSLKESDDGKICQCSLMVTKLSETGEKSESINKDTGEFLSMLKSVVRSYCSYDENSTQKLMEEFSLDKSDTYLKQGELTKKQGNFYFVYYSTELSSTMTIYNTYLREIEPTKKPVSKPNYGESIGITQAQ